jgi:hypothetical protein
MCHHCHNSQCDSGRLCGSKDKEPMVIQGISPKSEANNLDTCDKCKGKSKSFVWRFKTKEMVCFKCLGIKDD